MEKVIERELKRIEAETKKLEKKHAKARTPEQATVFLAKMWKLDGEFEAYMNVLKMIKAGGKNDKRRY